MRSTRLQLVSVLLLLAAVAPAARAEDVHLGMGLRVGDVTQTSAVVWTRITKNAERNWDGVREPKKRESRVKKYVPDETKIADRQGAMPGAPGEVRLRCTPKSGGKPIVTDWNAVRAEDDFTHQFELKNLRPRTEYTLVVEAHSGPEADVSAKRTGSFHTPAEADQWQDVRFAVISCQSYWDLDGREGYRMYPAMAAQNLDFLVPTGDTVYLDSEAPRARTVELARFHWHRMYSLPRHIAFHRRVPGYWEVDDHDSWCNDCWPTKKAPWMNPLTFQQGYAVFREQVPLAGSTIRTIRWGKGLQIWTVEGRLYRSPNNMPDGPEKTIWGRKQREWLKRTILESDADFRVLVSPTPIVGPDRSNKADNHANRAFAWEGNDFRRWTKEQQLENFYTCCGDRHWQYMSVDPASGLREFSCGAASDVHAGGNPKQDKTIQPFLRVKGGFLTVSVTRKDGRGRIAFRHHDVDGKVVHEFEAASTR